MLNSTWKKLTLAAMLMFVLVVAAACGSDDGGDSDSEGDSEENGEETSGDDSSNVGDGQEIELVYVEWDTEVASTNVVGKVLEDLGYEVELTPLDNAIMWETVASGEADGMVAAWLPGTHGDLYEDHKDSLVDLGANLEGAKIGLVVPEYMEASSIADLTDEADQTITGIEAGAGVVAAAESALEDYDNLSDWSVEPSSSGAMATALGEAIDNEENIIVTGWSPHWKFAEYDLKYLEDPEGSFGGEENIATMVREGLEEDMPNAYKVLDNFAWETADIESVMSAIQGGTDPEEAAANWVEENEDKVSSWTEGVE
ncbi:glycine/betaine ABC transporter substrate-binding protein [Halalkalibacillus sediminis]|uniref:Glycine/betaine ABC transporter substrate-binding protein n=1 Tax=Halalkalibacillus sediminis TaxID=2018042 RepID=A0A2I0QVC3_9BACI|nr:glycine betaine ABC transporter substrate-binding protein [Halalkalibacillus sediminis]PKR78275.1 glycine/betaine ABC transporter substrate-binding protein [Halalkalibacillus sediminis]